MDASAGSGANRWAIAWAGVLVMLCMGTVYAWSNFTQPLIASFNWSNTTTTLTFGLAIFFIGIGAVVGGRWQDRVGPRTVTITGAILWGVGNLLAAIGPHVPWWWYLTYGVIGGVGAIIGAVIGLGAAIVREAGGIVRWGAGSCAGAGAGSPGGRYLAAVIACRPRQRAGSSRAKPSGRNRRRRSRRRALALWNAPEPAEPPRRSTPCHGCRLPPDCRRWC